MRALGERLNPQGWLLIGHAEPNPTFSQWLQPVALPGTVAYRPIDTPVPPPPPVLVPALPDLAPILVAPPPEPAPAAAAPALPVPIPRPAPPAIAHPLSPGDLLAEIRVLADAGETARAWRRLHEEIDGYATDSPLRYYEGLLALDLGREREAERALRGRCSSTAASSWPIFSSDCCSPASDAGARPPAPSTTPCASRKDCRPKRSCRRETE